MPETSVKTIEHDIAELEHQLAEKKAALGHELSDKEVLHGIVGEKIKEHVPEFIPGSSKPAELPTSQPPAPLTLETPSYLAQELKDKIQAIINIVFEKNLEEGIKEVAKSGNIALIDAFHDVLVDELYSQLVEKNKLDKID